MLKLGKTTFLQVFRTTQNMFLHQETSILLFFNEIIKYGAGGGGISTKRFPICSTRGADAICSCSMVSHDNVCKISSHNNPN